MSGTQQPCLHRYHLPRASQAAAQAAAPFNLIHAAHRLFLRMHALLATLRAGPHLPSSTIHLNCSQPLHSCFPRDRDDSNHPYASLASQ